MIQNDNFNSEHTLLQSTLVQHIFRGGVENNVFLLLLCSLSMFVYVDWKYTEKR